MFLATVQVHDNGNGDQGVPGRERDFETLLASAKGHVDHKVGDTWFCLCNYPSDLLH